MKTQTPVLVKGSFAAYWQVKATSTLCSRSYACTGVLEKLYPETATAKQIVIHCTDEKPTDEQERCCIVFYDAMYAEIYNPHGRFVHQGFIMSFMRAVFHELESNANRFGFWVEIID